MERYKQLMRIGDILRRIEEDIAELEEADTIYGDLTQNFEDADGTRIIDRLINLVNDDENEAAIEAYKQ